MQPNYKILFVDDEPFILDSLKRVFRKDGYELYTSFSGEEALNFLSRTPVNLVISDQRMPGMSGSEFLAQVKAKHPKVLRMILTGYQDLHAAIQAINEAGVSQFLQKPWDEKELREKVKETLEASSRRWC